MLKIKDEVDLSELEKFGFKWIDETELCYIKYSRCGFSIYDEESYFMLSVLTNDRVIRYITSAVDDYINVIFDLIQANLVEKVEK